MEKNGLKIIVGGKESGLHSAEKFVSAVVTDTRMLGVLGLKVHWKLPFGDDEHDMYQFFYYDIEELGIETYRELLGEEESTIAMLSRNMFDALGGDLKFLSEREARYLISEFVSGTERMGQRLPRELEYLKKDKVRIVLSPAETEKVRSKICSPIRSDYELINYYLMRLFGHDFTGAFMLLSSSVRREIMAGSDDADSALFPSPIYNPMAYKADIGEIALPVHATFLKNTIEEYIDEKGKKTYLCESLVETENTHYLVMSEVGAAHGRISFALKRSAFEITPYEASLMLGRSEYVTSYRILNSEEEFEAALMEYTPSSTLTDYENGDMYMEFKDDNDHVNHRVFNLSDDIETLYFFTYGGQLILAAYSQNDIVRAERRLSASPVARMLMPVSKYEFKDPILFEFARSNFEDFEDFVRSLTI